MKRLVSIGLVLVLCLALLPMSAFAVTFITRVELIMDLPVAGQTPKQNCSLHGNGYTIHSIDWNEIGGRGFLEAGEKFKEDCTYEATIWVKAADGYEFSYMDSSTPTITAYINGDSVSATKAYEYNAWAMVCLTYRFHNIPAKGWVTNVNLTVPAPQAGEHPSYTQLTGLGYGTANVSFSDSTPKNMENGIAWYPVGGDRLKPGQDKFAENTAYTFHCLVFPAEGYKFPERATVWVNGKEAEASLDYDTFLSVEYTFPTTGKTPPTHTHSPSAWRTTGVYHYKVCTTCGDMLDQEDHRGGTATCTEKAKCKICGVAYGQEEPSHKWSPTYLYQDKTGHAWVCADCKDTSPVEKHTPGPAATETTPQTCKDCGYIIEPVKNHTHQLTHMPYVAATCLATGTLEHYTCSGCSSLFADAEGKQQMESVIIPCLTHETADDWGMDADFHWRSCKLCQTVLDETKMVHEMQTDKCATCGYEADAPATELTEQVTQIVPVTDTKPAGGESWMLMILIALVCFAAAVTVTVIILKKKK